jgi:hypothetical protein
MQLNQVVLIPFALILAACQAEPASEPADTAIRTAAPDTATPGAPADRAAPIDIGVLSSEHLEAVNLSGELGCSFMPALGGESLWIGMGDVVRDAGAQGVILLGGKPVKLVMSGTGGFDAMAKGARFAAGDVQVTFDRTADEPLQEEPQIAMESSAFPTTMTVTRGAQKVAVEGVLECGP